MKRLLTALALTGLLTAPAAAFETKGVALTSWGYNALKDASSRDALRWIRCLGATHITISTENTVDAELGLVRARPDLASPGAALAATVAEARALGLQVTIKPHYLNSKNSDHLSWPPYQPPNLFAFFESLRDNLIEHARLAQATGAERLVVGTELGGHLTGPSQRVVWLNILRSLRQVYKGKLSYAATVDTEWKDSPAANEAAFLSFWDALDEMGLNVYPKLTKDPAPDPATLEAAWRKNAMGDDTIAHLRALAQRHNKPVLILEHGFRSLGDNYWETGSWGDKDKPVDYAAQEKLLQASLNVLKREGGDWLKGIYLWEILAYNPQPKTRDWWEQGFVFRYKPAAETVRRAYGGDAGPITDAAGQPVACPPE